MGRYDKSNIIKEGDLVWCVYNFYKLPEVAVIIKIHTLNPVYNSVDFHYEVFVDNDVYTLHEHEIFESEDEALAYQMMQVKGYNKI